MTQAIFASIGLIFSFAAFLIFLLLYSLSKATLWLYFVAVAFVMLGVAILDLLCSLNLFTLASQRIYVSLRAIAFLLLLAGMVRLQRLLRARG